MIFFLPVIDECPGHLHQFLYFFFISCKKQNQNIVSFISLSFNITENTIKILCTFQDFGKLEQDSVRMFHLKVEFDCLQQDPLHGHHLFLSSNRNIVNNEYIVNNEHNPNNTLYRYKSILKTFITHTHQVIGNLRQSHSQNQAIKQFTLFVFLI